MTDDEIREMIRRLDEEAPAEDSGATIRALGGDATESGFTANRAGYLRMAMHFLEGAVAKINPRNKRPTIGISLSDVLKNETDVAIDEFVRDESPPAPEVEESLRSKVTGIGCAIVFVACLITGAITILWGIGELIFGW